MVSHQEGSVQDRILGATLALACADGPAAATVSAVAQRAGVSRMTVYRHFPNRQRLLAALLNRELGAITLRSLAEASQAPTTRQRVATAVAAAVRDIRDHPLMSAVLAFEPESLTPWLSQRFGATQRLALESLTAWIREGQADRSIRPGDPAHMAAVVVITAQSFVVAARLIHPTDDVVRLVDGYLTPTDL